MFQQKNCILSYSTTYLNYIDENAKCPANKYIIRTYVISTYIHSMLQNCYQQMTF